MGMKPRGRVRVSLEATPAARLMVAHGLVQGYLNDQGGEDFGFKMDEAENALVLAIAIALRVAAEDG